MFLTLDTNVIIYFLNGDSVVVDKLNLLRDKGASFIISTVTVAEILSYDRLTTTDLEIIKSFLLNFLIISVDLNIAKIAGKIRRSNKIKLGDALITATAMSQLSSLVTNDQVLSKKIKSFVKVFPI